MNWRKTTLGKICKVVGGSTPNSGVERYWGGDIIWVTPTDLGRNDSMFISSSDRRITREGYDSCGTEFVPKGAVVMSSRAPIGHLAIAQVDLCTNQGCKSFVPSEEIDSAFLYFALRIAIPTIRELGSGATFSEVSKSQLETFEISLPNVTEQKRIATILNEQMVAVEKARAAAETQMNELDALDNWIVKDVFESTEARAAPRKSLRSLCLVDGQYGTSEKASSNPDAVPVLRMGNLIDGRIDWTNLVYIDMHDAELAKYLLAPGDLLFNRTNSAELVGKTAVFDVEREAVFASYLIRFRLDPSLLIPA